MHKIVDEFKYLYVKLKRRVCTRLSTYIAVILVIKPIKTY